jgi:uncharacterized protein (TIGR04562 family)
MKRPNYLSRYLIDWEMMEVVIGGKSVIDAKYFLGAGTIKEEINNFLSGYGLESDDKVARAELFGNFQESLQFIKRYFLKEGDPDGIDLQVPNSLFMITNVDELFLMASKSSKKHTYEEMCWAEIVLKIMHTIMHIDKDLRSNYFPAIQTQIFDRFYKYLYRDDNNNLFLGERGDTNSISLFEFETKSKKSRDSVIIKLLHKVEYVAEELFDRVGIRFVTNSKFDIIRVIKFLTEKNIVIPHNIKPSRTFNNLIYFKKFKAEYLRVIKMAIRNNLSEERFLQALDRSLQESISENDDNDKNQHSSQEYRSVQFTGRQLIRHQNSFLQEFNLVKKLARETEEVKSNALISKILNLDISTIDREISFFYPFEVQVMDKDSHLINSDGEASHHEYKRSQLLHARDRLFYKLLSKEH